VHRSHDGEEGRGLLFDAMKQIEYAEQTVQAWMSANPNGILLPFARLSEATETLNVPLSQEEIIATFQAFVAPGSECIPFLVFWKAYSHLSRLQHVEEDSTPDSDIQDFLFLELETFRDALLRYSVQESADFPIQYLYDEIGKTQKMSEAPAFWDFPKRSLKTLESNEKNAKKPRDKRTVSMDEITGELISWLLDAITFQRERTTLEAEEEEEARKREDEEQERAFWSPTFFWTDEDEEEERAGKLAVYIHIYDVSQESSIRKLNRFLANKLSPLKFGGVFHAGVEVSGLEWSYGASSVETIPGIVCHEVKTHPQHRYRQTVSMGYTSFTGEQVAELISEMVENYPGWDYDLLRRNCCHFADDFCQRMGVGRIPGWIYRFARVGAGFDTMITMLKSLRGGSAPETIEDTAG